MSHAEASATITPPVLQLEPKTSIVVQDERLVLPIVQHQSPTTRRAILLAYWAVVALCIPIWWHMTSIERLSLPQERIEKLEQTYQENLRFPISIIVDPSAATGKADHTAKQNIDFAYNLEKRLLQCAKDDPTGWKGIDARVLLQSPGAGSRDEYSVILVHSSSSKASHQVVGRELLYQFQASQFDGLYDELGSTLCSLLVPKLDKRTEHRMVKYSSRYRLSFTLLNEDILGGDAPRGWAIETNLDKFVIPTLRHLGPLHNFTIESQVQYHAPLAFEPPKGMTTYGQTYYALGEDELKVFVNSADWSLSSGVTNEPVIHLVLFTPAPSHRPLRIVDETGAPKDSPAFIIPQWGGVVIFNPPDQEQQNQYPQERPLNGAQMFSLFRSIALKVLGVPPLPDGITLAPESNPSGSGLSEWQIDSLMRLRARENTRGSVEALGSIVRLVEKIQNMPVGKDVRGDVLAALEEIEQTHTPSAAHSTLTRSQRALELSSRAFFNPGMVGMLYFPIEHTYAIYMIFIPASLALLMMTVKEIKEAVRLGKSRDGKVKTE